MGRSLEQLFVFQSGMNQSLIDMNPISDLPNIFHQLFNTTILHLSSSTPLHLYTAKTDNAPRTWGMQPNIPFVNFLGFSLP